MRRWRLKDRRGVGSGAVVFCWRLQGRRRALTADGRSGGNSEVVQSHLLAGTGNLSIGCGDALRALTRRSLAVLAVLLIIGSKQGKW